MKKISSILLLTSAIFPSIALAQLTGIGSLITSTGNLVQSATIIVAAIALLAFFWGLAKFIFAVGGDAGAVDEGKALMKWGIIALFVMVSIWGIIYFIGDQIFPNYQNSDYSAPYVPTFPR